MSNSEGMFAKGSYHVGMSYPHSQALACADWSRGCVRIAFARSRSKTLVSSQVRIMRPMGTSVRHSEQMTSVHVATLESPLQGLSPESPAAPERQEFGVHGLRRSEALAANETPVEVSGDGAYLRVPIRGLRDGCKRYL